MKSLHYLLAGLLLLCFSACYKDKGNYTYHDINDIAIEASDTTVVNFGDTLHISPVLHQRLSGEENNLQFEWSVLVGATSLDSSYQVLATTRNLDIPVAIASQSAYYSLFYRVHNNTTNITYTKIIRLLVTSNFQTGWYAMEQGTTQSDISFVNTVQNKVYHHAYSTANPDKPLPAGAVGIFNMDVPAYQTTFGTVHKSSVTVALYDGGGYVLDRAMKGSATYGQLFQSMPQTVAPSFIGLDPNAEMITINDGQLYRRVMSQENAFASAFTLSDGSNYHLAPMNANAGSSTTLYFDVLNHRFLKEVFKTRILVPFTPYSWYAFDPGNVPEEPLALGVGYYKYYQYGIFKIPGMDSCVLYSYSQGNPLDRTGMNNCPGVASSKAFLFSTIRYQLYYGAGNQLYLYDIQANNAQPVYSFGPGESITAMKANGTNGMVVATYNGNEGFIYSFTFTDTGEINDIYTSHYNGFDKIISLSYKE